MPLEDRDSRRPNSPRVMPASNSSPSEGSVRFPWLKTMYVANIVISGGIGLGALLAPEMVRTLMDLPPQDPIHYGIAAGAVPLAFGVASVWGLRAPLRASPVLLLQACYKLLFLGAVALPLAWSGQFPEHAVPVMAIFAFFVVGDLIAVPFSYVRAASSPSATLAPE